MTAYQRAELEVFLDGMVFGDDVPSMWEERTRQALLDLAIDLVDSGMDLDLVYDKIEEIYHKILKPAWALV